MKTDDLLLTYWITIYRLKDRYRKTFAGFIWVILNPIIMYSVQALVFKHLLKIDVPNYGVFLLSGLLPWIFISQSLEMGVPIIETNAQLIRSINIKTDILILSQVFDNFINFFFSSVIVLLINLYLFPISLQHFYLLPLSLSILLISVVKFINILSTLQAFLHDIKFIMHFTLNIMIFLTPIFYPLDRIPENWRFLVNFNPFYIMIQHIRTIIYNFEWNQYLQQLSLNIIFLIILLIIESKLIRPMQKRVTLVI